MSFSTSLTYQDVSLVPQFSNIESRLDTDLTTKLTRNITMTMPLIPANMDTVICPELGKIIVEKGGIPIYHRFCTQEEQKDFVKQMNGKCFVSCGLQKDEIQRVGELLELGALGVCIDVAHGHCQRMIDMIKALKQKYPRKDVIAGNICSNEAYIDLVNAGADAVKVGVGSGSICTTRMVTGHGVPTFSAIYNCRDLVKKYGVPLIADGGITYNRDAVLALAAGASSVMMGSLFAKCNESAGDKFEKDGKIMKKYRGQASSDFQKDYYGKVKKGTAPEGVAGYVECLYSAEDFIDEFCGGVRSALTYTGVRTIPDFQEKSKFIKTHSTGAYMMESRSRI